MKDNLLKDYTAELVELLKEIGGSDKEFWYRGQRDAKWHFRSGAIQRIIGESDGSEIYYHEELIAYHEKLLKSAKSIGGNWGTNGRKLGDLELLAKLQHHGAATCLLDMTTNFNIALWFACQKIGEQDNDETDGKVFIVPMNPANEQVNFLEVHPDELQEPIGYFLDPKKPRKKKVKREQISYRAEGKKPKFWCWEPGPLMDRMLSQASRFIFSSYNIYKQENYKREKFYHEIKIDTDHKEGLLLELEQQQGLKPQNVFSDISGLAGINTRRILYLPKQVEDYLRAGKRKMREGNFEDAIEDLDQADKLEPENPNILLARGKARMKWTYHDAVELGMEKSQKILKQAKNDFIRVQDLANEVKNSRLQKRVKEKLDELDAWEGILYDFLNEIEEEYKSAMKDFV